MAKRKTARATRRKRAGKRTSASRARSRAAGAARESKSAARMSKKSAARTSAARKSAAPKRAARKSAARKSAAPKRATRKSAARKSAAPKRATRKSAARKSTAPKRATRKGVTRKSMRAVARTAPKALPTTRRSPARGARSAPPDGRPTVTLASVRKVPALDRERRVVSDDDLFPASPSSLDLDRTASSARTGRRELDERIHDHTETSPALTGGDVDADWAGAYATGDEAPGGDNPTPDQGIVDDIGKALGVLYEDDEELKGAEKISDRDKKRWELDPKSAEDYEDR